MILAHLSDLHLGYRIAHSKGGRLAPDGTPQRELDIYQSFLNAVKIIEDHGADCILVAGDVFDTIAPPTRAKDVALEGFGRLARIAPVLVVAGNHETPLSTSVLSPVVIFRHLGGRGVYALTAAEMSRRPEIGRVVIPGGVTVSGVPETQASLGLIPDPDPDAKWNVLLLHGEVEGSIPNSPGLESLSEARILQGGWDYVALGHYHVRSDLWPSGGYSGSTDYVSTDIWAEARSGVPKSVSFYDLESRTRTIVPIPGVRPVVDLPVVDGTILTPAGIVEEVLDALGSVDPESIVRQTVVVEDRTQWREIPEKALREMRSKCWLLRLDPRPEAKGFPRREATSALSPELEAEGVRLASQFDAGIVNKQEIDVYLRKVYGWAV